MNRLCKVTTTDDYQEYDAYITDENNIYMTREQLTEVYFPYDVRFWESNTVGNDRDFPVATIYLDHDEELTIESSPLYVDGAFIEVYCPDIELMEKE